MKWAHQYFPFYVSTMKEVLLLWMKAGGDDDIQVYGKVNWN